MPLSGIDIIIVRIFKTRYFQRWMRKTELTDQALHKAVDEMTHGLIDADLGGGIVKKRVGVAGRGKSGGVRTLLATNRSGFWLLAKAWPVLLEAQRTRRVADSGPYARIRHPQYVAFVLVMFGFLLQWPTLITLIMFPVLLIVYARLARREELDAIEAFGDAYRSYRDRTPAFIPRLR